MVVKKKNRKTSKKRSVKKKVDKSKFAKLETALKKSEQKKENYGKQNQDKLNKFMADMHNDMFTRRAKIKEKREAREIERHGENPRRKNYWCKARWR